ncbi:MAG TPA: hypothetical protein VJB69_02065 [Candidatus Paceibacterota bacterium]
MTKHQVKQALQGELRRLNEHIDWKILRGLPYAPEARRHRRLLGYFS